AAARGGTPRMQPRVRGQRAHGARRGARATSPSGDVAALFRECLDWARAPLGGVVVRRGIEALRAALRLVDAASAPRKAPGRSTKATATRKTNGCETPATRHPSHQPSGAPTAGLGADPVPSDASTRGLGADPVPS